MIVETINNGYLPSYAHEGDAGADLSAIHDGRINPTERLLVSTGIKVAIPQGYAGLIMPRSGLALRKGVTVLNTPGLIDAGYRGELKVLLYNAGDEPYLFSEGERIAQLMITPVVRVKFESVLVLDDAVRGEGGFGSTGTSRNPTVPDHLRQHAQDALRKAGL